MITRSRLITLFISLIILLLGLKLNISLLVLATPFIVSTFAREINKNNLYMLCAFSIIFYIGLSLGIIRFTLFSQAKSLYDINQDVVYWFRVGNPHAIRLFLAYPGILISKHSNLLIDDGFSIYIAMLFVIYDFMIIRIMTDLHITQNWAYLFIDALIMLLALFMNGRIVLSFVGSALLVYIDFLYRKGLIKTLTLHILTVCAFLLSQVSSGTMLLLSGYILIMMILRIRYIHDRAKKRKYLFSLFAIFLPLVIMFLPTLIFFLEKNISFYGGGINGVIALLQHGMGAILYKTDSVIFFLLLVIGVIIVIVNYDIFRCKIIKRKRQDLGLLLLANLSVYGALVGRSTGSIGIVPMAIAIITWICSKVIVKLGR